MSTSGDAGRSAEHGHLPDRRQLLTELYWAAVRAASPGPVLRAALGALSADALAAVHRVWIIAVGKSAAPMAGAAVEALARRGMEPAGGVIIGPQVRPVPHRALEAVAGDHPVPGARSLAAAARVGQVVARVRAGDEVWMLLSGGATSLMAAPAGAFPPEALTALYELVLGSGLPIAEMNLIRKRFSRWGAGRLAVALAPARVRNFIISDVIGDDPAAIGSGPCVPDPTTASDVRALLVRAHLWERLPPSLRDHLEGVERDPSLETPKPDGEEFAAVEQTIIADNRGALGAIAARARELGLVPHIVDAALAGEAVVAGARVADAVMRAGGPGTPCLIWGGETTVTLDAGTGAEGGGGIGLGGRCQELALAAARAFAEAPATDGVALLAAGTDGRDGPTDAAGAIVDRTTWEAIRRAGRDPARDLRTHDAYPALDAAGALLRTGLTTTNVMDVVIGVGSAPSGR